MLHKQFLLPFAVLLLFTIGRPNLIYAKQEVVHKKVAVGPDTVKNIKNSDKGIQTLQPLSRKEVYEDMGYKDIQNALQEFEKHHKEDILLPEDNILKTYNKYGKYYSELDLLKLDWEKDNKRLQINITDIPVQQPSEQKLIMLNNGIKAYLTHSPINYGLEFNKDGLHYVFLTYKDKNIPLQQIREIAESL